MQYEDDVAFQRAILANPADTTLKLVYADWLQDRADSRAEFVRAQVAEPSRRDHTTEGHEKWRRYYERLVELGRRLDPKWVAFMMTLAQAFEPGYCSEGDPFAGRVGMRGKVNVFESQYRKANELTDALLADLAFLISVEWGYCPTGVFLTDIHGFVCDLPTDNATPTAADIRTALGSPPKGRLTQQFREQDMFVAWGRFNTGNENSGPQGQLKRYVIGGQLWYFATKLDRQPASVRRYDSFDVELTVGCSPHGNRLVGALTYQLIGDA